jgi:hypothetical protein
MCRGSTQFEGTIARFSTPVLTWRAGLSCRAWSSRQLSLLLRTVELFVLIADLGSIRCFGTVFFAC